MDPELTVRAGHGGTAGWDLDVTPGRSPLRHAGLRTVSLAAGGTRSIPTAGAETVVVPLQGAAVITVDGRRFELEGRADVFGAATDVVYVPAGATAELVSPGSGRFAFCTAPSTGAAGLPPARLAAQDVPVERRGAGTTSRLVRNFGTVDGVTAEAVIACEVITPAGNWSSYPAHKHDETTPDEAELEEIYYYEVAAGPHGEPGLAFHRTSASPGHAIDETVEVHDRDTVLVPHGWHGPVAAAPGHDLYQLNVMAGPAAGRRWAISDHPEQAWIRATWAGLAVDPRLSDGRFGA